MDVVVYYNWVEAARPDVFKWYVHYHQCIFYHYLHITSKQERLAEIFLNHTYYHQLILHQYLHIITEKKRFAEMSSNIYHR